MINLLDKAGSGDSSTKFDSISYKVIQLSDGFIGRNCKSS